MTETTLEVELASAQQRANTVNTLLVALSNQIERRSLDLCELLAEAWENDYHAFFGYAKFGNWVSTHPTLGMSESQAYSFIRISTRSKALGITREQLDKVKISKLKEIFSLDPANYTDAILALVDEGAALSLDQVRNRVRVVKGMGEVDFLTLKLEKEVKAMLDKAVELARKNYGSVQTGSEVQDISVSKAVELIVVNYLEDPNNNPDNEYWAEGDIA